MTVEKMLRKKILASVANYYKSVYLKGQAFSAGQKIPYAGRIFDKHEMTLLVDSALDFWLTAGRYANRFENDLAEFLGVKHCSLVNSGSSANLLAFMALTAPELGRRRIRRGDEVITVAAGFPTTVTPAIQYGAIPVFVDVTLPSYNIDCSLLKKALSSRTRAVMVAHTLGNPFDIAAVKRFCDAHNLWLIEDNCDSLGSKYKYKGEWRYTGTIGDLGTSSFYPPHHITMGEGGAVYTNNATLHRLVQSYRDWGRDCWCESGRDNTCKRRFTQQFGQLPKGYDHKYVYSHFGYNLKCTEMQAAIGCAQLEKLPDFIQIRKRNWSLLREGLHDLKNMFILPEPSKDSEPSWFGFLLTVREGCGLSRADIIARLEASGIQTRMLFAGNMIRHPCFDLMRQTRKGYRTVGKLENTDLILKNTFWIGVYPGMTKAMIAYMISILRQTAGKA